MIEVRIWIRVRLRSLIAAIAALKERSVKLHEADRRREADDSDENAEELRNALRRVESGEDEHK